MSKCMALILTTRSISLTVSAMWVGVVVMHNRGVIPNVLTFNKKQSMGS